MASYTAVSMAPTMPSNSAMPSIGSVANNCTPEADARREQEERTSSVNSGIRNLLNTESPELINDYLAESHSAQHVADINKALRAHKWRARKEILRGYLKAIRDFPKDVLEKLKRKDLAAAEKKRNKKRARKEKAKKAREEKKNQAASGARGFEPRVGISQRDGYSATSVIYWSRGTTLRGSWNPSPRNGSTMVGSSPRLEPLEESPAEEDVAEEELPMEEFPFCESPAREAPLRGTSRKSKSGRWKKIGSLGKSGGSREREVEVSFTTLETFRRDERGSRFTEAL